MKNLAIYIHYPFCKSKCPYCDFNSHVNDNIAHQKFTTAYLTELAYFKEIIGKRNITSIFFGGGTPSLMPLDMIEQILSKISDLWQVNKNIEITLEANPTSGERKKFRDLKSLGINRLSIGVQALNDADLEFLGREHSAENALETITAAQKLFDNFSFDLIYARAKQTTKSWQSELEQALKINAPHLSLYQLTIEKATPFYKLHKTKKFTLPDDNLQHDLYDLTNETCNKYGLDNYEISNYSKENYHSRHNLNYWNYGDYLGIGAGSHSRISFATEKKSLMNYHLPQKWLDNIAKENHAIQHSKSLTKLEILNETAMMGLRSKFGVELNRILENLDDLDKKNFLQKIDDLSKEKLLKSSINKLNNKYIYTSEKGKKLLNSICNYLLN